MRWTHFIVPVLVAGLTAGYLGNQARWNQTLYEEDALTAVRASIVAQDLAPSTPNEPSPALVAGDIDLARALAEVPLVQPETPIGSMRGRVIDSDEQPIAGARIKLSPLRGPARALTAEVWRDTLEEYIVHRVRQHQFFHGQQRTTESGADGTFLFAEVAAGMFGVTATKSGYHLNVEAKRDGNTRFEAGDEIRISGVATVAVLVQVKLLDGSAPKSATIMDHADGEERNRLPWTSNAPRIELTAGHHILTADAGAEFRCEPQLVLIVHDAPPPTVSLALLPSASLRVRWSLSARESANTSQTCWYLEAEPDSELDAAELMQRGQTAWSTSRDRAGVTCEIRDVSPGHYWVGAGRGRIDAMTHIEVREGVVEVALEIADITDEDVLRVTLLDAAGQPSKAAYANFQIQNAGSENEHLGSMSVLKKNGHVYELLLPFECKSDLARGPSSGWTLRVYEDNLWFTALIDSRDIVARAPPRANVHLTLSPMPDEGAESNYSISIRSASSEEDRLGGDSVSVNFDADHWQATTVPGAYAVTVHRAGRELSSQAITLSSGDNAVVIPIEKAYRVTVNFAEGTEAPQYVVLMRADSFDNVAHAQVDGRTAVLEDVPAGNFTLVAARSEMDVDMMGIAVRGETSVVFRAAKFSRLIVKITQPVPVDSPWAVLRDGDYVTGVDGKPITSFRSLALTFMSAMAKPEISVTLERAGEIIEIKMPGQSMLQLQNELDGMIQIRPDLEPAN